MLRWTAAILTTIAVGGGAWGVMHWLDSGPPPLGDISPESVTPPNTEVRVWQNRSCDKDVPGYWAEGQSRLPPERAQAWFDSNWGPARVEPTARLNAREGLLGRTTVYEEITVWIVAESEGSRVRVTTYENDGHFCTSGDMEYWDVSTAWVFTDHCGKLIINFWGVEYGAVTSAEPPQDWVVQGFAGGQAIAHGLEEPLVIYARTTPDGDWARYEQGNGCFLD